MTQNFLTHKRIEKRYEKSAIPASELVKMREEERAQERMTGILKQMQSPKNFASPTKNETSVNHSMISTGFRGKELAHSAKQIKQMAKTEASWMQPVKCKPDAGRLQ